VLVVTLRIRKVLVDLVDPITKFDDAPYLLHLLYILPIPFLEVVFLDLEDSFAFLLLLIDSCFHSLSIFGLVSVGNHYWKLQAFLTCIERALPDASLDASLIEIHHDGSLAFLLLEIYSFQ
jgi:hypothetical protein